MELTKQDTQKAKGVAILGMLMLHLFCRLDNLPYTPWLWIGSVPVIYYLSLFGGIVMLTMHLAIMICRRYFWYLFGYSRG